MPWFYFTFVCGTIAKKASELFLFGFFFSFAFIQLSKTDIIFLSLFRDIIQSSLLLLFFFLLLLFNINISFFFCFASLMGASVWQSIFDGLWFEMRLYSNDYFCFVCFFLYFAVVPFSFHLRLKYRKTALSEHRCEHGIKFRIDSLCRLGVIINFVHGFPD